jgi:hypothetical protein
MSRSSDHISGWGCDSNYIGIVVCWYQQYAGINEVVDCAELKGFPSECFMGLGDIHGSIEDTHEAIVSGHSVHELYGGIINDF